MAQVQVSVKCAACRFQREDGCLSGVGPLKPKLMIVTDLPAREDFTKNTVMQGKLGMMQRQVVHSILKLDHEKDVYYTYAIKGETKGETVEGKEIQACKNWLLKEIYAVQPEYILLAGNTARQMLLGNEYPMAEYRGKLIENPIHGWKIFLTWSAGYVERYSSFILINKKPARECKTGSVPWFYVKDMRKLHDIIHGG